MFLDLTKIVTDDFIIAKEDGVSILETPMVYKGSEKIYLHISRLSESFVRVSDNSQAIKQYVDEKCICSCLTKEQLSFFNLVANDYNVSFDGDTGAFFMDLDLKDIGGQILKVVSASISAFNYLLFAPDKRKALLFINDY